MPVATLLGCAEVPPAESISHGASGSGHSSVPMHSTACCVMHPDCAQRPSVFSPMDATSLTHNVHFGGPGPLRQVHTLHPSHAHCGQCSVLLHVSPMMRWCPIDSMQTPDPRERGLGIAGDTSGPADYRTHVQHNLTMPMHISVWSRMPPTSCAPASRQRVPFPVRCPTANCFTCALLLRSG